MIHWFGTWKHSNILIVLNHSYSYLFILSISSAFLFVSLIFFHAFFSSIFFKAILFAKRLASFSAFFLSILFSFTASWKDIMKNSMIKFNIINSWLIYSSKTHQYIKQSGHCHLLNQLFSLLKKFYKIFLTNYLLI